MLEAFCHITDIQVARIEYVCTSDHFFSAEFVGSDSVEVIMNDRIYGSVPGRVEGMTEIDIYIPVEGKFVVVFPGVQPYFTSISPEQEPEF